MNYFTLLAQCKIKTIKCSFKNDFILPSSFTSTLVLNTGLIIQSCFCVSRDHTKPGPFLLFALPCWCGDWYMGGWDKTFQDRWSKLSKRIFQTIWSVYKVGRIRRKGGDIRNDDICFPKTLLGVMWPCTSGDGLSMGRSKLIICFLFCLCVWLFLSLLNSLYLNPQVYLSPFQFSPWYHLRRSEQEAAMGLAADWC